MIHSCPQCGLSSIDWQPFNISDQLCIAFRCSSGHRWQENDCEAIFPVAGDADGAAEIIRECQAVICAYLPPDSGISERQAFNHLLEILDGPAAQQFGTASDGAEFTSSPQETSMPTEIAEEDIPRTNTPDMDGSDQLLDRQAAQRFGRY